MAGKNVDYHYMVQLRQAIFEDHIAIAQLHAESWKKNYRGIWSEDFLDHKVDADRQSVWFQRLKSPTENQHTIVAVLDNTIVGFCCIFLNDHPVFGSLIDNLHVSSKLQNSGIGKMLLMDCAEWISSKSINWKMYLWVYKSNTNARTFYERLGGVHFETVEKTNNDGTRALSCRYIWNNTREFSAH